MLDDASVAVAWLRERHRRVGMLGVSLGGSIAARAAADGLAIDALALLETPPQLHFTAADVRREALALTEPFLLDLFGEVTPAFLGYTIYDLVRVQSTPRIRCTIGTVDLIAALDVPGSLPRIAASLLLIYGARDAIVKPRQAEQVRQLMPPGARFHMIPGASHLSLTLAPTTLRLVGDWMAEHLCSRYDCPPSDRSTEG
jgi:pimeloyl-ACP methyl ester carboxylesterase